MVCCFILFYTQNIITNCASLLAPKKDRFKLETHHNYVDTCFSNAVIPSFPWLCFYTLFCHFIVYIVDVSNLKSFVWRARVDTNVTTIQVIPSENPLSDFLCAIHWQIKIQMCSH